MRLGILNHCVCINQLLSSTFYFLYLLKGDYLSIHEANSPKQRQKDCLKRKLKKRMLFPVFIHFVAFTSKNAFILRFYLFCYVIHVMLLTIFIREVVVSRKLQSYLGCRVFIKGYKIRKVFDYKSMFQEDTNLYGEMMQQRGVKKCPTFFL